MSRRRNSNNQTINRFTELEIDHRDTLSEMCMNRFEWKGLPDSVDVRWLELNMLQSGLAIFWQDKPIYEVRNGEQRLVKAGTNQWFATGGTPSGKTNWVGNPVQYTVVGPAQGSRTFAIDECVPIWSNYRRVTDNKAITIYANRLAHLDRTIEINSLHARRTKIIAVGENGRLTSRNVNDAMERGDASITVSPMNGDVVTAVDLGIEPRTLTELSLLRTRIWNDAMTRLGLNNSNQDKKERLVSDEVDANNEQVDAIRRVNLNMRQKAAKDMSKMLDSLVTVDYYGADKKEEEV